MKIKEFANIISGSTPKTGVPEYWDGELLWITPAEIKDEDVYISDTKRKITPEGVKSASLKEMQRNTILLTSRAPIGKVAIVDKPMYCNQGFKNLECDEEIVNPKYLYYWLSSRKEYLNDLGRGATFKEISKGIVGNIDVPIYDIPIQAKIVEVLDKSKKMINNRKEQIEILDKLVENIFYNIFGHPFLNDKNFNFDKLGSVTMINPQKNEIKEVDRSISVSFIPMESVGTKGDIYTNESNTIENVYSNYTYFKENDVLFAKITPCMENGKGAISRNLINGIGFGSTEFHVLRSKQGESTPEWIYYLTRLEIFRETAEDKMTGSAGQRRVGTAFLENVKIVIPPIELQNQFAEIVNKIEKEKELLKQSLEQLETNFKALEQKAFNGELFN